ncbi:DNA-directed RNA polymerase I subunit Rpa49p [Diutina catenulata]
MGKEAKTTEIAVSAYHPEPQAVVGSFFNGLQVPSSVSFDVYANKRAEYLLHGETDKLDYNGTSEDQEDNDYFLAVYDPKQKSAEVFAVPVVDAKVTARSKRRYQGPSVRSEGQRIMTQRNALGDAFGTKKAKQAIANMERNRVDAEKLQDIESNIVDNVREATLTLPTREKMAQAVVEDRPTPRADVDATNVVDIYPVSAIIPTRELQAIRVRPIMEEVDTQKQLEMMPFAKSTYLTKHVPQAASQGSSKRMQLLYYVSFLMGVYANRRVRNKAQLMERLNNPAEVLVDGALVRFTVSKAGTFGTSKDRSFLIDPHHEDKLLCYMLALILHIDNFVVELPPLAHELQMKPTRLVGLFKALGATIKSASVGQAEAFGISKSQAASYKVASLKVPFKLPEMVRRGAKRN